VTELSPRVLGAKDGEGASLLLWSFFGGGAGQHWGLNSGFGKQVLCFCCLAIPKDHFVLVILEIGSHKLFAHVGLKL
jgi:hypothetical protein